METYRPATRWETCREDFCWDGALRDIYIAPATMAEWQTAYSIARGFPGAEYLKDGVASEPPKRIEDVFDARRSANVMLSIRVGRANVVFHFFSESEIECDIDPREVNSQADLDALLSFMSQLGDAIGKQVLLTCECASFRPPTLLSYDPATQKYCHHEAPSSDNV